MDIGTTVSAVRREYKDFLRKQNPNWTETVLKTHVADAFFIWNYTIVHSFWKCLLDDASVENAKNAIFDYLENEIMSDNAMVRTEAYVSDLKMLKSFLDDVYGGVEKRVGYELNCEKTLYNYAKQAYEGNLTPDQAVSALSEQVPCFSITTHKMILFVFDAMMKGQKYTRRTNLETTLHFITQIGHEYGDEYMKNALFATQENIKYYYEQTGSKSPGLCRECKKITESKNIDVSFDNSIFNGIIPKQSAPDELISEQSQTRYWLYSNDAWDEIFKNGIITIGRDYLGDPTIYNSRQEMQSAMQDYGTELYATTYQNASLEVWQFITEMKPGDIVIVKEGRKTILGRGIVESDFLYDEKKPTEFKYYRKINWTHKGNWEHPGSAITKRLTDITPYPDYIKKINELFGIEAEVQQTDNKPYTKDDFLSEVFIDETNYTNLVNLLKIKKNIILQGAPGVGKTFIADRLAYSIMGEVDTSRIKMIQFHQSYSYEDFIMGYRPTESGGFVLQKGEFYNFCRKAAEDGRDHFFIIDEINRGNLSKIFGELFMLIEADKRGNKKLNLLYSNEQFSIPSNLYIIGMMNTADRSLAMMDYALRRRFAFVELSPAFENSTFKKYAEKLNNPKFLSLIQKIQELNNDIEQDATLGRGFRIGHSYFYEKDTNLITDSWMQSVVNYEIIPLLEEYWFDEPEKTRNWSEKLKEVVDK